MSNDLELSRLVKVHAVMTREVVAIRPADLVTHAAHVMTVHGFAALPVAYPDGLYLGVLTDADARRAQACFSRPMVDEVMSDIPSVSPDDDVATVGGILLDQNLRSVAVVEDGYLVGIVARRDLLRMLVNTDETIATHVRHVLADCFGERGWEIGVHDAKVSIAGDFADARERALARSLAATVAGVNDVTLTGAPAGDAALTSAAASCADETEVA